jgi:hypothetical protein
MLCSREQFRRLGSGRGSVAEHERISFCGVTNKSPVDGHFSAGIWPSSGKATRWMFS